MSQAMQAPSDDNRSSQDTRSSATNLSPNAREFFPNNRHQSEVLNGSDENSGRRKNNSGAVPKTFYNDNKRRYNPPRRYDYNKNDSYRNGRPSNDGFRNGSLGNYRNESSRNDNYRNGSSGNENYRNESTGNDDNHRNGSSSNENYRSGNGRDFFKNERNSSSRNENFQRKNRNNDDYDYGQSRKERQHHEPKKNPPQKQSNSHRQKKEKSIDPSKISQREQLIKDIERNSLECMICMLVIRDHQPTWSCTNCFHILHLNCIRTWISNSKNETDEWRCVACQFLRKEVPKQYTCFCGKERSPAADKNHLAHSCGEMCGRTDNCPHPCMLLCHPGPHAVCQSFVQRSCGCGKSSKTFQCSMKDTFDCEEVCEKTLNCGVHKCGEKCHQGECKPCAEPVEMKCFCRKENKTVVCSPEDALITEYSCAQICDLPLSCKNHQCRLICHPQKCTDCTLSPELVKTCPCGRTTIDSAARKTCTDPIPLCKATCGRNLKCGPLASPHTCTKPCHLGDCPPCAKSTNVKCRCGRIEEKIQCKDLTSTDVRCKKKCTKFKSCGRHKCNQNCCIELEHLCLQQCGRPLECKKHRCAAKCHIGNCIPCQRASFDELRCECGAAVVYPPVPCGTKVPECSKKCLRKHKCTHPVNHLCHSEPDCPPCVYLTSKFCYGKHEQRKTIPCNQESFSCGMPCGSRLKCARHKCIKKCHVGECEKPGEGCKQPCTIKKKCGHNCNAPCHEGPCPDKLCKEKIEVSCVCGNIKDMESCEQVDQENCKLHRMKIQMQVQNGETLEGVDMEMKKTLKILKCSNDCATVERNRRLDIAFKVENPNLISYPKFVPNYTEFIRTFYKKEPVFVNMVHEKLTELVKSAKESKLRSRSYSFPVMNRDKRHAVHDLAAMFGVETQAFDAEPNRNVVATASRESSWLPSLSLSEVLQREIGVRQVRPPSMLPTKK